MLCHSQTYDMPAVICNENLPNLNTKEKCESPTRLQDLKNAMAADKCCPYRGDNMGPKRPNFTRGECGVNGPWTTTNIINCSPFEEGTVWIPD